MSVQTAQVVMVEPTIEHQEEDSHINVTNLSSTVHACNTMQTPQTAHALLYQALHGSMGESETI